MPENKKYYYICTGRISIIKRMIKSLMCRTNKEGAEADENGNNKTMIFLW